MKAPGMRRAGPVLALLLVAAGGVAWSSGQNAGNGAIDITMEVDGGGAYLKKNLSLKFTFVNRMEPPVTIEPAAFGPGSFVVTDSRGSAAVPAQSGSPAGATPVTIPGYSSTEHTVDLSAWYPRLTARETTWEIGWIHPGYDVAPMTVRIIPAHDPKKDRFVVVETDLGKMKWELLPDLAPRRVARFVDLVRQGHYDGLAFFRYIPGVQAEGGAPAEERPDLWARLSPPEIVKDILPGPGLVGALRPQGATMSSMTSDSMFFVTLGAVDFMRGSQTFFARIVDGYEVMAKMNQVGNRGATGDARAYRLIEPVMIQKMSVRRR